MPADPVRYRSEDEDSARWAGFPFRDGDIVISARSKSGTTWMQMICALLVFQTPDLGAPLPELSPWLDWLITPRDEVYAQLAAQRHRRFVKTHTPLNGIPLSTLATYIVVARHPLDMAVSLYYQGDNIDRVRLRQLTRQPEPDGPPPPRPALREWLLAWIDQDASPREQLDSLPGVMWHLSGAWDRRGDANVVLVHYDDLSADLEGEMRRLAARLAITVPEPDWPALVNAATFERMRASAARLAPDPAGVLASKPAFFRRGTSGSGRELLTAGELARYRARTARMAPQPLLAWLHRENSPEDGAIGPGRAGRPRLRAAEDLRDAP
jgi:aryl sulfotransferase